MMEEKTKEGSPVKSHEALPVPSQGYT